MANWEPFAFAMFRGIVAATPLDDDRRTSVLGLIDTHRVKAIEKADQTLREGGMGTPGATPDEAALKDVERLSRGAWSNLRKDDQKRLRNLAKLIALEEDPFELTSLIEDWTERVCASLLGQPLVRAALLGALEQAAPPLGPGRVLAGKFRLERLLGEGGFGQVYAATHLDLGKQVAVKVMRPEIAHSEDAKQRFLREVSVATSFVHKYAVQVREFGRDRTRGSLYCTMDLIEGETIRQALKRETTLGVERTLALAVQVLEALDEAHASGLVHRDIKPSNLMIVQGREGPEVRILDFGIAKAAVAGGAAEPDAMRLTVEGSTVGTLAYMSPEQAEGASLDGRSDLYSLAVVIYECLSGELPISSSDGAEDSRRSFLTNLLTRPPRSLGDVAPSLARPLRDAVMRALAKEPNDRYADAAAFRAELLRLTGAAPDAAVDRDAATMVDYHATLLEIPVSTDPGPIPPTPPAPQPGSDQTYQATLADLPEADKAELAGLRGDAPASASASGRTGGGLLRLVVVGALGCFVVATLGGISAIWWGPKAYDLVEKRLRSPEVAKAAKAARDEAQSLAEAAERLSALEGISPPSETLSEAKGLQDQAAAAWQEDELERATKVYQDSKGAYRRALSAIAGQLRERADASLAEWGPLARTFQLESPAQLAEARALVTKGARAAADGQHQRAADHFLAARARYGDALTEADQAPPRVRIESPLNGLTTTQAVVRLEGRVEDATLRGIELDGTPLDARPDGIGAHAFSIEVPLTALGKRTLTVRARDAANQETVVTREVERKAVPLVVTLTEPEENARSKTQAVTVRGKVSGAVAVTGVTINGEPATLEGDGFHHIIKAPQPGALELQVVARGSFAEGRAARKVLVDWTAPTLTLPPLPLEAKSFRVTLKALVSDDTACEVRVERGATMLAHATSKPGKDQEVVLPIRLTAGVNALQVVAIDRVGNRSIPVPLKLELSASARLLGPYQTGPGRYRITSTITVPAGERLVIPAGSLLTFGPKTGLIVLGELALAGQPNKRVLLTGKEWIGLSASGNQARVELNYATIRDAKKSNGGGLLLEAGATLRASHTIFSRCQATNYGGAIHMNGRSDKTPVTAKLERVTFLSCSAGKEGGAVNCNNYTAATFDRCQFSNSRAGAFGGAIIVIGNSAHATLVTIRNSRFEGNHATYGGAVEVARGARATLSRTVLVKNTAQHGAGFYAMGQPGHPAHAKLIGCTFQENVAKDSGGALRIRGHARVDMIGGNLTANRAVYGGGIDMLGVAKAPATLTAREVVLHRNSAKEGGAANVNTFASATFDRCTLRLNEATHTGGAIIAFGKKPSVAGPLTELILTKNTFDGNKSPARRGPDLRIGRSVQFDPASVTGNGLLTGRYQIDALKTPKPGDPIKPTPPKPTPRPTPRTPTAFGRALTQLINMAWKNDFSTIRGSYLFTARSGNTCFQSSFRLSGASKVQVWRRKNGTQFVAATYVAGGDPLRALKIYRQRMELLKQTLGARWVVKEGPVNDKYGGRTCTFKQARAGKVLTIRLDTYTVPVRGKKQANVSLFVN